MGRSRSSLLLACFVVLACEPPAEPGESRGSTTPRYEREAADASALDATTQPVRIGELGPAFDACAAHATPRDRSAGATLAVRAAPFDSAGEIGQLGASATFFICSRSLDQKWLGIVYDTGGTVSERCGVSRPVPARRDYAGPCRAGWVASAFVRPIARRPNPSLTPDP